MSVKRKQNVMWGLLQMRTGCVKAVALSCTLLPVSTLQLLLLPFYYVIDMLPAFEPPWILERKGCSHSDAYHESERANERIDNHMSVSS